MLRRGRTHRRRFPRWVRPDVCLVFSALSGCLGGQTGGEYTPEPGTAPRPVDNGVGAPEVPETPQPSKGPQEDHGCARNEQAIALTDSSQLGFSATDVLEATLGVHSAPLHWNPSTGLVSYGPEAGESGITLSVTFDDGRAFFIAAGPAPGGAELACRADHLEVDVRVRLETYGGALAEEFPARLRAERPDLVTLSRALPLDTLKGSFFVELPRNQKLDALNVQATFTSSGTAGVLSGTVVEQVGTGPDASVGAQYVKFADWP